MTSWLKFSDNDYEQGHTLIIFFSPPSIPTTWDSLLLIIHFQAITQRGLLLVLKDYQVKFEAENALGKGSI